MVGSDASSDEDQSDPADFWLTSPFKRFTLRLMYTRVLLIIMPFLLARSLVLLRINRSRRRGLQSSLPA